MPLAEGQVSTSVTTDIHEQKKFSFYPQNLDRDSKWVIDIEIHVNEGQDGVFTAQSCTFKRSNQKVISDLKPTRPFEVDPPDSFPPDAELTVSVVGAYGDTDGEYLEFTIDGGSTAVQWLFLQAYEATRP